MVSSFGQRLAGCFNRRRSYLELLQQLSEGIEAFDSGEQERSCGVYRSPEGDGVLCRVRIDAGTVKTPDAKNTHAFSYLSIWRYRHTRVEV
jgi:hypothetical protein